MQQLLAVIQKH